MNHPGLGYGRLCRVQRWQHGNEAALALIKRNPLALDLAENNPVLLWLLANAIETRVILMKTAKKLVLRKQAVILRKLYPENRAISVNLIRKIQPEGYNLTEYEDLEWVLRHESVSRSLLHCKQIYLRTLSFFVPFAPLLRVEVIRRILETPLVDSAHCEQVRRVALRGCVSAYAIDHDDPWGAMSRCSTLKELNCLVDRWMRTPQAVVSVADEWVSAGSTILGVFPPLAPGTRDIEPIISMWGLFIEGREMRHCLFNYAGNVMNGKATAYRVLKPQRGTLLIARGEGELEIEEFRLEANAEPDEASWRKVRNWLEHVNRSNPMCLQKESPAIRQARLPI